jgi:hypothetical protein
MKHDATALVRAVVTVGVATPLVEALLPQASFFSCALPALLFTGG